MSCECNYTHTHCRGSEVVDNKTLGCTSGSWNISGCVFVCMWHTRACVPSGNGRNKLLTQRWQAVGIILNILHLRLLLLSLPPLFSLSFKPLSPWWTWDLETVGERTFPSQPVFSLERRDEDRSCAGVYNIDLGPSEGMSGFSKSKTCQIKSLEDVTFQSIWCKSKGTKNSQCVTPCCWPV